MLAVLHLVGVRLAGGEPAKLERDGESRQPFFRLLVVELVDELELAMELERERLAEHMPGDGRRVERDVV